MKLVPGISVLASALLVGCAPPPAPSPGEMPAPTAAAPVTAGPAACVPLESAPREAPDRAPAFAGQTRTCGVLSNVAVDVAVLTTGLERPWAVEPLPDGSLLVTEKAGQIRVVTASGEVGPPVTGVPAVDARRQGACSTWR
ncbi:MAG TPA: PQQ-dependent sugar dehydrogenase, partial [Longimicrobiaceae bacterium]